jgi:hypothetical protein
MSDSALILARAVREFDRVAVICGYRDGADCQRANARAAERPATLPGDSAFVALWMETFDAARAK